MKNIIIPVIIILISIATLVAKGQNTKLENRRTNSTVNWDSVSFHETSQMTKNLGLSDKQKTELLNVNLKFFKSIGQLPSPQDSVSMRRRSEQLSKLKLDRDALLTKLLTETQMNKYNQDMKAAEIAFKQKIAEREKKLNTKTK